MIISHKHKFVFIKTNKTAGTSVEIFLSSLCGGDDVITPISEEDELIRQRLGFRGPQNYLKNSFEAYNHMSISQVCSLFGNDIENYFRFCIERHPAERVVSHYFWENRQQRYNSLDGYFRDERYLMLKRNGWELYTVNNKLLVDKVIMHENLEQDLYGLFGSLSNNIQLPHAKSKFRKDRRPYHEILTSAQVEIVKNVFSEEMNQFGYRV